ncbi:MAG: methionyl-tRNA formyltransferase [Thiobacillaceae bacterium]
MRLIFAGTPEFAAAALNALHDAGHTIALVLTQPDRPAGRGMKLNPSAVKRAAERLGLPLSQPTSLKTEGAQDELRAVHADLMIVAAYGLILPQAVLDIPKFGCLNIHASLLPRWRGAAPIQRAILAGDGETGITIMQMDAGLDTGAMLLKHALPIDPSDTAGSLHDKLAQIGATSIVEALTRLGSLSPQKQDEALATYAAKISKAEAKLDWQQDAFLLARQIRAYNPFPGAFTTLNDEIIKIWRAEVVDAEGGQPGEMMLSDRNGVMVACGTGALKLLDVQPAGGKSMSVSAFAAGRALSASTRLGS